MSEKVHLPPEHLYRGIVVPVSAIDEEFLTRPLLPGAKPRLDEHNRVTVNDGNEYGVYMSDNKNMVKAAYADPRHGEAMEDVPHVSVPKVGVLYQIDPTGIEVRRPWITGYLESVYNNGFGGDEWIADSVPPANYQVLQLKLGRDLLERETEYPIDGDFNQVLEQLQADYVRRVGSLTLLGAKIAELPEWKRRDNSHLKRIAAAHKAGQ